MKITDEGVSDMGYVENHTDWMTLMMSLNVSNRTVNNESDVWVTEIVASAKRLLYGVDALVQLKQIPSDALRLIDDQVQVFFLVINKGLVDASDLKLAWEELKLIMCQLLAQVFSEHGVKIKDIPKALDCIGYTASLVNTPEHESVCFSVVKQLNDRYPSSFLSLDQAQQLAALIIRKTNEREVLINSDQEVLNELIARLQRSSFVIRQGMGELFVDTVTVELATESQQQALSQLGPDESWPLGAIVLYLKSIGQLDHIAISPGYRYAETSYSRTLAYQRLSDAPDDWLMLYDTILGIRLSPNHAPIEDPDISGIEQAKRSLLLQEVSHGMVRLLLGSTPNASALQCYEKTKYYLGCEKPGNTPSHYQNNTAKAWADMIGPVVMLPVNAVRSLAVTSIPRHTLPFIIIPVARLLMSLTHSVSVMDIAHQLLSLAGQFNHQEEALPDSLKQAILAQLNTSGHHAKLSNALMAAYALVTIVDLIRERDAENIELSAWFHLISITVGGVKVSCKSANDRASWSYLLARSMIAYYHKHSCFPDNFTNPSMVDIVVSLFQEGQTAINRGLHSTRIPKSVMVLKPFKAIHDALQQIYAPTKGTIKLLSIDHERLRTALVTMTGTTGMLLTENENSLTSSIKGSLEERLLNESAHDARSSFDDQRSDETDGTDEYDEDEELYDARSSKTSLIPDPSTVFHPVYQFARGMTLSVLSCCYQPTAVSEDAEKQQQVLKILEYFLTEQPRKEHRIHWASRVGFELPWVVLLSYILWTRWAMPDLHCTDDSVFDDEFDVDLASPVIATLSIAAFFAFSVRPVVPRVFEKIWCQPKYHDADLSFLLYKYLKHLCRSKKTLYLGGSIAADIESEMAPWQSDLLAIMKQDSMDQGFTITESSCCNVFPTLTIFSLHSMLSFLSMMTIMDKYECESRHQRMAIYVSVILSVFLVVSNWNQNKNRQQESKDYANCLCGLLFDKQPRDSEVVNALYQPAPSSA